MIMNNYIFNKLNNDFFFFVKSLKAFACNLLNFTQITFGEIFQILFF